MADLIITERQDIVAIANAVRNKTGKTNELTLSGIVSGINGIETGVELPELENEGVASELFTNKQLIDSDGNVVTGTFSIDDELDTQNDLIAQIKTALEVKAVGDSQEADKILRSVIEKTVVDFVIPDGVAIIGEYIFTGCYYLRNITIPDSVTIIGERAFNRCMLLTSVIIPDSVTSIGHSAFLSCTSLTSITIGNGVTSIGSNVFYNCNGLTNVTCTAITPPTLGSDVFPSSISVIYVPASSVNVYKSSTNWSQYADFIRAIPE